MGLYVCVLGYALKCICVCILKSISSLANIFCCLIILFFWVEKRGQHNSYLWLWKAKRERKEKESGTRLLSLIKLYNGDS